jgi:hypothetical protein
MCRLHAEPEARAAIGRAARRAVEHRFPVPAYVRRLYALYGLAPQAAPIPGHV